MTTKISGTNSSSEIDQSHFSQKAQSTAPTGISTKSTLHSLEKKPSSESLFKTILLYPFRCLQSLFNRLFGRKEISKSEQAAQIVKKFEKDDEMLVALFVGIVEKLTEEDSKNANTVERVSIVQAEFLNAIAENPASKDPNTTIGAALQTLRDRLNPGLWDLLPAEPEDDGEDDDLLPPSEPVDQSALNRIKTIAKIHSDISVSSLVEHFLQQLPDESQDSENK